MTATLGELVNQIRQAIDEAYRLGRHRPGRPALVELTGASDYEIRKALAELANEQHRQPPGQPGLTDLAGATDHQVRHAWIDLANEETSAGQDVDNAGGQPGGEHPDTASDDLHSARRPADTEVAATDPGDDTSAAASTTTSVSDSHNQRRAPGGRLVAGTGFVFGSITSIAANVLHAWLPAAHEPPGWSPGIPPQIGATVWPIGLMLAVEALSRIHWPPRLRLAPGPLRRRRRSRARLRRHLLRPPPRRPPRLAIRPTRRRSRTTRARRAHDRVRLRPARQQPRQRWRHDHR